jgi:predicted DCC family thiol-disulfide oxidoreductase YuxK
MTVLIYDGECPFCEGWVRRLALRDRRNQLRFATRSTRFAAELFERHPQLRRLESMILVTPDDRVFTKSDAVIRAGLAGGGVFSLAGAGLLLPKFLRDAGYDVVASLRRRLSRGRCGIGPGMAEVRQRMLP